MCLGGLGPATGIVVQQHHAFHPTSILAVVRRLWAYLAPLRVRVEPIPSGANVKRAAPLGGEPAWKPQNRARKVSAALQAYAAMTTSADTGAVRDVSQLGK
jgi:hypothetical protein